MPISKPRPAVGNLPAPLSDFIGRKREIADIKQWLVAHRLVTLTGPGGSGKTRLALQVADELREEYEDGVWLAELASLSDGALVTQTVATHMNVREQSGRPLIDTLADHLFTRRVLLVIDNCEHLIQECAQFTQDLLQKCPNLRILATSREMLGVAGESVFATPPLTLPQPQPWKSPASPQNALDSYGRSEAVQLFVNRGTAIMPEFALNAENGAWVSEICRRLDGMPLAIELAAARVRTLSVQQIAQKLDDRFHLLTGGSRTAPPRQQTLLSTLDWSYALLSGKEQKVLQRLSVFAGGCTLAAAEVVCSGNGVELAEVLDVLSHLVDKCLVLADKTEDEARYNLLETIRQYAREKLVEAGDQDETKNRHLDYFQRWARQVEPLLTTVEQLAGLNKLEEEHDNLRAALDWSLTAAGGTEKGLQLAVSMANFWKLHGHITEGRRRLSAALAQEAARPRTLVRARALFQAAILVFYQSDYSVSRALTEESLAIFRELGPAGREGAADALENLAEVSSETGDYPAAAKFYEESLALSREAGYLKGIFENLKMMGWLAMREGKNEQAESMLEESHVLMQQTGNLYQLISPLAGLAELAIRRGQYSRANDMLQQSLDLARRLGHKWQIAIALGSLGWMALRRGDFKEMKRSLAESLAVRIETGDKGGTAWCLEKLAEANSLQSHYKSAVVIFGAASALRAHAEAMMDGADRPEYERMITKLRTELGEEAFRAAWVEGEGLPLETVVDYALHETELAGDSARDEKEKFGGLTGREREVAVWIAKGKSNREIAEAMTVGAKTVETYVTRILDKLGFDSRVQIATWAMENGLKSKESQ
jgi:non-specific serine/threonine protein kinase